MLEDRLQKILSAAGVCSRRQGEAYITAGRVTVNGRRANLGDRADPARDVIALDGRVIGGKQTARTVLMLCKPRGVVTTLSDEKGRKTVADLVKDCPVRVWPVGRLDMDSEGLLLLTDDGDLTNTLTHPRHEIETEYHVWVTDFSQEGMERLKTPLTLDGRPLRPAKVRLLRQEGDRTVLSVIIHEGRNRQIRRICEKAELKVVGLCRIAIGELRLGELPSGKWRHLTEEELAYLHAAGKDEQYGY